MSEVVADEQDRRERLALEDLPAVLVDEIVAGAEQREPRGAEDVLRLEFGHPGALELSHIPARDLLRKDERQIRKRGRIVGRLGLLQPPDRALPVFRHAPSSAATKR